MDLLKSLSCKREQETEYWCAKVQRLEDILHANQATQWSSPITQAGLTIVYIAIPYLPPRIAVR
jgi:hypothetical protein